MSAFTDELRKMADFIDAAGLPDPLDFTVVDVKYHAKNRAEAAKFVRALGKTKKLPTGVADLWFDHKIEKWCVVSVCVNRADVCRRVLKETKTVPATPERVIPAVPEHTEDVYEWECDEPILKPAAAAESEAAHAS